MMKYANWFRDTRAVMVAAVMLVGAGPVRADAVQEGRDAFARGEFSVAARAFETALSASGASAGLYYNLAMAQMKDGQRPQAALSLHRAIMLDPRLTDARVALSDLDRSLGVPLAPGGWRTMVAEKVPLQVLFISGCLLAWLGAFLVLFAVFKRGKKIWAGLAAGFFLVLGSALFVGGALSDPRLAARHSAVVLADGGVALMSAPADQSATVTRLPAGASLRILQRSGEWTYCQAPKGEKGWAPSASLEAVVPSA